MQNDTKIQNDYSIASLDYVIVEKDKLLTELRENKEKHRIIYEAACSGYWCSFENEIKQKTLAFESGVNKIKEDFSIKLNKNKTSLKEKDKSKFEGYGVSFSFDHYSKLTYPTHHFEDYERVEKMLEFSVADKIKLTVPDFEKYARNNWDWKNDFCITSQNYISNIVHTTGSLFNMGSGYLNTFAISGIKCF